METDLTLYGNKANVNQGLCADFITRSECGPEVIVGVGFILGPHFGDS